MATCPLCTSILACAAAGLLPVVLTGAQHLLPVFFEVRLRAPRHSLRRRAPLRDAKTQVVSGACSSPLCSLAAGAPASGADRSAALASSVFEGVRSKMKQLQATVDVRDHRVAALEADMQAAAQEHRDALREAQQRQKAGAAWGCSVCLMG